MSAPPSGMGGVKECKFLIPARLHVELHRHRVLTGQAISESVRRALDRYLDTLLPEDYPAS